jgi:hypothetical protein
MIYEHDTDIEINFYNDKVKEIIPDSTIEEPFTYVPIKAGHMELVCGNAIVFGKITEGQNGVEPDVDIDYRYSDLSIKIPRTNLAITKKILTSIGSPEAVPYFPGGMYYVGNIVYVYYGGSIQYYVCMSVPDPPGYSTSFNEGSWSNITSVNDLYIKRIETGIVSFNIPVKISHTSIYFVHVKNKTKNIDATASYPVGFADNRNMVMLGVVHAINTTFGPDTAYLPTPPSPFCTILMFPESKSYYNLTEAGGAEKMYANYTFSVYILDLGFSNKFPNLKYGATHQFGVVYKDHFGRQCSVIKPLSMSVYLPFFAETDDALTGTIVDLVFKISHIPPEWAESYEIGYAGNVSMSTFLQIRADYIHALPDGVRYAMNIVDTMAWTREHNLRWKTDEWHWQDGDRVRLMGFIDNVSGLITKYDELYDYEIEGQSTVYGDVVGGDWLIFQAIDHPVPFDGTDNIIVELYRPLQGIGTTFFYGTGMVFDVGTNEFGYKYHKGDIDQVIDYKGETTTKAEVLNTANDSWKYIRLNYKHNDTQVFYFWAESACPSDWWNNQAKLTSQGWPFLYTKIPLRQSTLDERIRNGGFLVEGTEVNEIAHFVYTDYIDLPKKNGDITALREIGYTLKVLQMHKETSIYIQRIQTFNPDGTEQFTLISELLGTSRPEETDFGCQHPDSVMVNGRNLYYWDNNEGAFIRSAPNGQKALSGPDYKIARWFKDLLLWINSFGRGKPIEVHTGANIEHDEVWLTFRFNEEVYGVIFSEADGRWKSRLDQRTEGYVHIGNWFAHMFEQKLYIMNKDEGQQWLTWAGIPTVGDIQLASNINTPKMKVFNALAVYSDHQMDCNSRYIMIPLEASYALMETYVAVWDETEGIYYGKILKDQNSPGNFADEDDKTMNGREMRGRFCYVRLRTEEHDEKVRIDSVIIFSTDSERSS